MNVFIECIEHDLSYPAMSVAYIGGGDLANWGVGGPPPGPCYVIEKNPNSIQFNGIWWKTELCNNFGFCVCEKDL